VTSSPHDAFFRAIFSEPHAAAAELRAVPPAPLLEESRLASPPSSTRLRTAFVAWVRSILTRKTIEEVFHEKR
jgi:hypothetical protein